MPGRTLRPLLLAALTALILAITACTSSPSWRKSTLSSTEQSPAQRLADAGNYAGAAAAFQSAAADASGDRRTSLLLQATRYYVKANDIGAAQTVFHQIPRPSRGDLAVGYRVVEGELAMGRGLPDAALTALGSPPASRAPASLRLRYHLVRAAAFERLQQKATAADARFRVADLAADPAERVDNQNRLLLLLAALSANERADLLRLGHPHASGWIALADAFQLAGNSAAERERSYRDWRSRFPNHPAASGLDQGSASSLSPAFSQTGTTSIGVLLPAGGPYIKASTTIREGIMAALYSLPPQSRPAVRFYDTTSSPAILDIYHQAVNDGARLIIGPLTKESVGTLSQAGFLPTPVLALNQVSGGSRPLPGFYQFSLSPEEEGRHVAERAAREGFRNAAVLIPTGNWGTRYSDSFRSSWEASGGFISSLAEYDLAENDFAGPIREALASGPDFVYLIGKPLKSRQLRTQIQFYGAATLPVFLSSQAVENPTQSAENLDLNGAYVPAMPWVLAGPDATRTLEGTTTQGSGEAAGAFSYADPLQPVRQGAAQVEAGYGDFFAMGFDALDLALNLQSLSSGYGGRDGATGHLTLDASGVVHREPTWITFVNGQPQPLASQY